jgi:S-adenosylmethionine/arginine decarboxylase-like enzyme
MELYFKIKSFIRSVPEYDRSDVKTFSYINFILVKDKTAFFGSKIINYHYESKMPSYSEYVSSCLKEISKDRFFSSLLFKMKIPFHTDTVVQKYGVSFRKDHFIELLRKIDGTKVLNFFANEEENTKSLEELLKTTVLSSNIKKEFIHFSAFKSEKIDHISELSNKYSLSPVILSTKKFFWLDIETSGLDSNLHQILRLSLIVTKTGGFKKIYDFFIGIKNGKIVDNAALLANGRSKSDIVLYPDFEKIKKKIISMFKREMKNEQCILVYHNRDFIEPFLIDLFAEKYDEFFKFEETIDMLTFTQDMSRLDMINVKTCTLENTKAYFNIFGKKSDSLDDAESLKQIFRKFFDIVNDEKIIQSIKL